MKYDVYEAPEGYLYVKDGVGGKKVIVPKGSNVIDDYQLVKIEKENEL